MLHADNDFLLINCSDFLSVVCVFVEASVGAGMGRAW